MSLLGKRKELEKPSKKDGCSRFSPPLSLVSRGGAAIQPPKYKLVVMDIPWQYGRGHVVPKGTTDKHYTTADWRTWSRHLDIRGLTQHNCTFLLWTTAPKMDDCMRLAESWGLKYVTVFLNWIKVTKDGERLQMGLGRTTRINAEYLLMFYRGRGAQDMKNSVNNVHNVLFAPRTKHSEKPKEAYAVIETIFDVKKHPALDMFARQRREGWDVWGNEIPELEEHLKPFVEFTSCQTC